MHPNRKDVITHEQARQSLQRFVNLHFHNAGEKSRASVPAHQDDDDILLSDYISQQAAGQPSGVQQEQHLDPWDEPHTVKTPVGEHGPSCEFIKDGKGTCGPDCGQPSGMGEPRVRELAMQHWPTYASDRFSTATEYGICSCGAAKANGVRPYDEIWADHMAEVFSGEVHQWKDAVDRYMLDALTERKNFINLREHMDKNYIHKDNAQSAVDPREVGEGLRYQDIDAHLAHKQTCGTCEKIMLAALAAPAPFHGDAAKPSCSNCGHSYAQHTKGITHPQKYCRHCPCSEWAAPAPKPELTSRDCICPTTCDGPEYNLKILPNCPWHSRAPKPAPPAEPDARFEAHTKAVADFLNELYAIMVDPLPDGPIKVAEMQRALLEAAKRDREYSHFINYYNVEATARLALERWRMKPHNAKWWKKIDGTPIPNDLIVCISEDIAVALRRAAERKP